MLAANLELYAAQRAMSGWARDRGVRLTIFHGRGGALGRGGGPASRAIEAQPPGSVAGRFKVTEQGEVAFARYGSAALARRHLEQLTSAVVRASARGSHTDPADAFVNEIETMSDASRLHYEELVRADGFVEFFRQVTPIAQIGTLPIASRPVARGMDATTELDDLRAIPWVFAWGQSRVNLTGWYGLGVGLSAVSARRGGLGRLRAMARGVAVLRDAAGERRAVARESRPRDRGAVPGARRPARPDGRHPRRAGAAPPTWSWR